MKQLIKLLKKENYLKDKSLEEAFLKIKREDFVPDNLKSKAAENRPLPIGESQTISQPAVVAFMLEKLNPQEGDNILDVGSGSGWTTALLAEIVGPTGKVVGVERVKKLKKRGEENIAKYGFLEEGIVELICGDGSKGFPKEAPFDRILVSAALNEKRLPQAWVSQLKTEGVLVVPIKNSIYKFTKRKDGLEEEDYYGFRFVPLIKNDQ